MIQIISFLYSNGFGLILSFLDGNYNYTGMFVEKVGPFAHAGPLDLHFDEFLSIDFDLFRSDHCNNLFLYSSIQSSS